MEIRVEGIGHKNFAPNQINLRLIFNVKGKTQEEATEKGLENVKKYVDFLQTLKFKKQDIKTNSIVVDQNRQYDEKTRQYKNDGFSFAQSMNITFDYNLDLLSTLVAETSKLKNPPNYYLNFSIKEKDEAENEVLALAYQDAERQAKAIAKSAGKQIKECTGISFEPFEENIHSNANFGVAHYMEKSASIKDHLKEVFVPEDVKIEKTIYCIFTTK